MPRANRHNKWTHNNWVEPYRSAWKIAIEPGDVFRTGGPANELKSRTIWNNECAYGRYREFLARRVLCDDGLLPDVGNLRAFDAELTLAGLAPYSRLAILTQLTGALRLMFPDADLHYLNKIAVRKAAVATPVRPVEARIIDPINLREIGSSVMLKVVESEAPAYWDANRFRYGVLIKVAATFPLRHGNWHMMIIGRHIDLETGRVTFTAAEMKRKAPFGAMLPADILVLLRIYVTVYRPLLLDPEAADEGYLWPSRSGGMCHRNTLGRAVKATIRRETGRHFNFHLFRHSAATFIAERRPEQMRMAAGVLHHRRLRTTLRYYVRGQRLRSFKLFQKAVRELIAKERRRQSRRRGK
ncbi:MAG: tyrosine-type recombinase/integrase [Hyphomicrobiaceae bacterium]